MSHDLTQVNLTESTHASTFVPGLLYLDASDNLVSEDCLASGVLEGLESLLVMDLSGNKLTSLPSGSLRGLRAVRRLDLSANSVASVSREDIQ